MGLPEGPPNIFPQASNLSLPRHPLLIMRPWAEKHLAQRGPELLGATPGKVSWNHRCVGRPRAHGAGGRW